MLRRKVTEQRKALGLSISSAARAAGINRATWSALERGERETEEYIFGGVERALGWQPGSIDNILDGGAPTPVATRTPVEEPARPDIDALADELRGIANNPNRSAPLRAMAQAHLDQLVAIREANEAEARARGELAS